MRCFRISALPLRAALVTVLALALSGCFSPDNAYLMELNRNGKWRQAERVGQGMLEHRATFTFSQTCETFFHVAYAETRLGKADEAKATMKEYDDFRSGGSLEPRLLWLGRETARLKGELGLLSDAQESLVAAMEAKAKGDYAAALDLCEETLSKKDATQVQAATANLVAAASLIQLKDAKSAESYLVAFDSLKASLPPDHQALAEENFVRQGLAELKAAKGK